MVMDRSRNAKRVHWQVTVSFIADTGLKNVEGCYGSVSLLL